MTGYIFDTRRLPRDLGDDYTVSIQTERQARLAAFADGYNSAEDLSDVLVDLAEAERANGYPLTDRARDLLTELLRDDDEHRTPLPVAFVADVQVNGSLAARYENGVITGWTFIPSGSCAGYFGKSAEILDIDPALDDRVELDVESTDGPFWRAVQQYLAVPGDEPDPGVYVRWVE